MQCPLCGCLYEKPVSEADCSQCAHYEDCDIPRCPNCYLENVIEPRWYENVAKQASGAA
jgi:hypothetical protein